eukprot:gene759-biopygen9218
MCTHTSAAIAQGNCVQVHMRGAGARVWREASSCCSFAFQLCAAHLCRILVRCILVRCILVRCRAFVRQHPRAAPFAALPERLLPSQPSAFVRRGHAGRKLLRTRPGRVLSRFSQLVHRRKLMRHIGATPGSLGRRRTSHRTLGITGSPVSPVVARRCRRQGMMQHLFGKIGLRSFQRRAGTRPVRHPQRLDSAGEAALPSVIPGFCWRPRAAAHRPQRLRRPRPPRRRARPATPARLPRELQSSGFGK